MSNYLIITGGSQGIGKETILSFQQNGWSAVNISRSTCNLPNVINFNIDLSSAKNIERQSNKLQEIASKATTICLVHNAARYKLDTVDSLSLDNLQLTLEINLISAVVLNKIVIPFMQPNSSIIYLGSALAEKAVPGNASYIISKHAVVGLMRATCQDLSNKHIHTCCICPGLVDTRLLKDTMDQETINKILQGSVIGKRLIEPTEIAKIIYFSATTPVINGEVIHANLGQIGG